MFYEENSVSNNFCVVSTLYKKYSLPLNHKSAFSNHE